MKALVIILALVGVTFIGLLIYGGSGNQEPKRACQQLPRDPNGNYTVPDDWCPPSIAKATRSLQARFAPGLDLPKPGKAEINVGPQQDSFFDVPSVGDPDKRRTAKLTLVRGNSAIVEGPDKAKQCLCKPKQPVPPQLQGESCSADWREEHRKKGWICQSAGKWGAIPIGAFGGRLTFDKGPAAQVEVQ
jgi:hypothetical protein